MTKFALFDINAGLLQWTGEGETARDVLIQFDDAVGINPHALPMDEVAVEFRAYEIDAADEAALAAWGNGSAAEFPLADRAWVHA